LRYIQHVKFIKICFHFLSISFIFESKWSLIFHPHSVTFRPFLKRFILRLTHTSHWQNSDFFITPSQNVSLQIQPLLHLNLRMLNLHVHQKHQKEKLVYQKMVHEIYERLTYRFSSLYKKIFTTHVRNCIL